MTNHNPTNLVQYKSLKKLKIIVRDIDRVMTILSGIKKCLAPYGKYVHVRDIYSNIMNNEAILKDLLNRYKERLNDDKI